ncbi:hypothetical protein HBH1_02090 [Herbaspirillum sp. BH-1]|uniref:hypothetical protein n=1 Tax=Herbaspirillum sp. (strain BH-1) TaxID=2058884 RepID=UPI000CC568E2|nr:hypothetical protein [Herbaspirillum sp. BH-1]PLY59580.1 hypothetical protein HBH1_02090 [Herbaspirillum sp. BH-1]
MKLFDAFSKAGYHTTIITTFGVDFSAYEQIVLPRLNQAGSTNNLLLADERMLGLSLIDGISRPKSAGQRYSVLGVPSNDLGVFHPKMVLQLGRSSGRLLLASANMTASGLVGNLEIVGEVVFDGNMPEAAQILCSALAFLSRFIEKKSIAGKQVEWAAARTPWLLERSQHAHVVDTGGARMLGLLTSDQDESIGRQFVRLVGRRRVQRLIVASPYWDKDLSSLRVIKQVLNPRKTSLLIQKNRGLFPVHRLSSKDKLSVHNIDLVSTENAGRFAHAKIFIAETDEVDCLLFGSANCTEAALGLGTRGALNHEASIYKELPRGEAVRILGLGKVLSQELEIDEIAPYKEEEKIPLAEMEGRLAGRMEMHGDVLHWWLPHCVDLGDFELSFTDRDGRSVGIEYALIAESSGYLRFKCTGTENPMFAHAVSGDTTYAPIIIVTAAKIRNEQHRIVTKFGKSVVDEFQQNYSRPGLWLLDVIQRIERYEAQENQGVEREVRTQSVKGATSNTGGKKLSYEEFVAAQKSNISSQSLGESLLRHSGLESVRAILNVIIGRTELQQEEDGDDAESLDFSTGDDEPEDDNSLEKNENFNSNEQITSTTVGNNAAEKKVDQHKARDSQKAILKAVEKFSSGIADKIYTDGTLSIVELVRLRALIMVILDSGCRDSVCLTQSNNDYASGVLPSKGESGWKEVAGRLLYPFFRAASSDSPWISYVAAEYRESEAPVDVVETIYQCIWTICAMFCARDDDGMALGRSDTRMNVVRAIYFQAAWFSGLERDEMISTFRSHSEHFGEKLGVDHFELIEFHQDCARKFWPAIEKLSE